jgi:lipopolysaccharide biosynthesis protein
MKIGIFIHLFHTGYFNEFAEYINRVKREFGEVFIIFTLPDNEECRIIGVKDIIKRFPECHILYIENKGVDVYSFLKQVQFVRENNIKLDYILKLHTKTSNQHNVSEWRRQLIEPITNEENLKYIHHIFSKKEIGYIASQSCIFPKKFDVTFKSNYHGILNISKRFKHITENYMDFIAGTIFWINYKIIEKNLTNEVIDYLMKDLSYEKPPSNFNSDVYPEYIFERLITGSFCFDYTNILVNRNKITGIDDLYLGLHAPATFTFHRPKEIMETFFYSEKNNLINLI